MTDVATNLNTIDGSLSDIKTAIVNKGGTVSGNITTFATAIDNIPSGGGGGKYSLLDRVTDDNDNEIGTVCGFFTDANDTEYAVVCLDTIYRHSSKVICSDSSNTAITNLSLYYDLARANFYESTDTATSNTQKILDYCTANNYTSTACEFCRSQSFIIDGVTYYGQLPTARELVYIAENYNSIQTLDTHTSSSGTNGAFDFSYYGSGRKMWSSTYRAEQYFWYLYTEGVIRWDGSSRYTSNAVCPILEIPNI